MKLESHKAWKRKGTLHIHVLRSISHAIMAILLAMIIITIIITIKNYYEPAQWYNLKQKKKNNGANHLYAVCACSLYAQVSGAYKCENTSWQWLQTSIK